MSRHQQVMITLDQESIEALDVIKYLYQENRSKALRGLVSAFKDEKPELFAALKSAKAAKEANESMVEALANVA